MSPEQALDRIDQLLDEERAALRRLDGARVDALTDEKAALVRGLQERIVERPDLAPRLRVTAAGLRRNAVLLAHARDCLRDVLSSLHDAPGTRAGGATTTRLSLRG